VVPATHAPAMQTCVPEHVVPHAPQASGLADKVKQNVPKLVAHEVSPGRQTQVPVPSQ